jgi:uncharacterized protein (TIGR02246 family)
MRSQIISAVVVLGLVAPAHAQQVDQNTKEQIEKTYAAYHEAWNKQDGAGIAGLYTKDGVLVTDMGVNNGTQEIVEHYKDVFKRGITHHDSATVDQFLPLGSNAVMTVGEYHLSGQGQSGPIKADGHYTAVNILDGGAWKIRLLTATNPPPPTSAATR